jgi:hypothetical protein
LSGPGPREDTERELRAAVQRLLGGRAIRSDGTLNVSSLAAEAGVSRQALYRNHRLALEEFQEHLRRLGRALPQHIRTDEHARRLAGELQQAIELAARYRAQRDDARRERDANACQVLYLAEQNRQLRQHYGPHPGVTPLAVPTRGGMRVPPAGVPPAASS